jgi:hypothetical protein
MRSKGSLSRQSVAVGIAVVVVVALAVLFVPKLIPKSAEQKYDADREFLQRVVLAHHTGYAAIKPSSPVTIVSRNQDTDFHRYPTFAVLNRGASSALNEADAGSEEITTLGVFQTNPVGELFNQSGDPVWEDVDGDGVRDPSADRLFYHDASPPPTVDHWNTTRVTVDDAAYVVDSRDWLINVQRLLDTGFIVEVPESASPDNHPSGTGSYTWYVDSKGKVDSLLYSKPVPSSTGFQGVYP